MKLLDSLTALLPTLLLKKPAQAASVKPATQATRKLAGTAASTMPSAKKGSGKLLLSGLRNIGVSPEPCYPVFATTAKALEKTMEKRAIRCRSCGLDAACGMQTHRFPTSDGAAIALPVCPLCHAAFHLDAGGPGSMEIGTIIWLPELDQATLNLISVFYFLTETMGLHGSLEKPATQASPELLAIAKGLKTLYDAAEDSKSTLSIDDLFPYSDEVETASIELADLTSPQIFAQQLLRYRSRQGKPVSAQAMQGLRLLPRYAPFEVFVRANAAFWGKAYPISEWPSYPVHSDVTESKEDRKYRSVDEDLNGLG